MQRDRRSGSRFGHQLKIATSKSLDMLVEESRYHSAWCLKLYLTSECSFLLTYSRVVRNHNQSCFHPVIFPLQSLYESSFFLGPSGTAITVSTRFTLDFCSEWGYQLTWICQRYSWRIDIPSHPSQTWCCEQNDWTHWSQNDGIEDSWFLIWCPF